MRQFDPCGEHGRRPGGLESEAEDDGAGDPEGAEGEGGALWGEGEEREEDWVSAELIGGEIAFEGHELAGAGERGRRVWGSGDCGEIPAAIAECNKLVAIFVSRTKNATADGP